MEEEHKQKLQENPSARPLKFVEVDGANHFVREDVIFSYIGSSQNGSIQLNWDDPERFVRVVADNV